MKALVLAAGLGTRLRPLTNTIPKHLIPVANKPTLHYVMDRISETSIKDVGVVISPENGDQIRQSLSMNPWEFKFSYITQDQPLGLAHAVIVARSFLKKESGWLGKWLMIWWSLRRVPFSALKSLLR